MVTTVMIIALALSIAIGLTRFYRIALVVATPVLVASIYCSTRNFDSQNLTTNSLYCLIAVMSMFTILLGFLRMAWRLPEYYDNPDDIIEGLFYTLETQPDGTARYHVLCDPEASDLVRRGGHVWIKFKRPCPYCYDADMLALAAHMDPEINDDSDKIALARRLIRR